MKQYKVLAPRAVFHVKGQEYAVVKDNIIELDENEITTRALLERGKIEEIPDSGEDEDKGEAAAAAPVKKTTTKKTT